MGAVVEVTAGGSVDVVAAGVGVVAGGRPVGDGAIAVVTGVMSTVVAVVAVVAVVDDDAVLHATATRLSKREVTSADLMPASWRDSCDR